MGPHYRLARSAIPIERLDIGLMNIQCRYCLALHFNGERKGTSNEFNSCCNFGNVVLQPLQRTPPLLEELLNGSHPHSNNFRTHIRNYNNALAMVSMGAQLSTPPGHGPFCYRIHGMTYHRIGPAIPSQNNQLNYGSLYFLDSADALEERMRCPANSGCLQELMSQLGQLLMTCNPFAQSYKMMKEVVEAEEQTAHEEGRTTSKVTMIFDVTGLDSRRYNIPTANEVAVVYVSEDGEVPLNRSIAVHHRGGGIQNISQIQKECDPLTYPLIFPLGDCGWFEGLQKQSSSRRRTRITQKEFYCYRLAIRNELSILHKSGKLFQQYLVDSYVKIEQNRLNWIRNNQTELRAETYTGLMDYLAGAAADNNAVIGRRCILPASFVGSPRSFVQSYQDSMAIVRRFGKPDFFITVTCNPKWPEIQRCLSPNETASDRPDIVARVFQLKLKAIQEDLYKNNILGKVLAYVWVIEFQKRGLPHCHMLQIMDSEDKVWETEEVDTCVCAEIPDEDSDPQLYETISRCMMHGPCGDIKPNAPCMVNGECSKKFPKEFREQTSRGGADELQLATIG